MADVQYDKTAELHGTYFQAASTLDPHKAPTQGMRPYWIYAYDRLFSVNTGTPEPELATGYEFSADGLAMTIDLRTDVVFADGSPLDAEAVKLSLERAKNVGSPGVVGALATVEAIATDGPFTVVLKLSAPTPQLPAYLGDASGAIINPAAFADDELLTTQTAGSGAFQSVKFVPDVMVRFERTDQPYWNPEGGRFAAIEMSFVPDTQTVLNGLQSGEFNIGWLPGNLEAAQQAADASDLEIHDQISTGPLTIFVRNTRGDLGDVRVRQAFNYALDRQGISSGLFAGDCVPTSQLYQPGTAGYLDKEPYEYDPAQAAQLLKDAGAVGTPIEIVVLGDTAGQLVGNAAQAQLNEVGFNASVRTMPTGAAQEMQAKNIDTLTTQSPWMAHPLLPILRYFLPGGIFDLAGTEGADLSALVDQLTDPTLSKDELADLYKQLATEVARLSLMVHVCAPLNHIVSEPGWVGLDFPMPGLPDYRYAAKVAD